MTVSERKLWAVLRKLDLGFRRQAPMGRYVADFVHHGAALIVELDGARHDLPEAQLHDLERDAWPKSQGYRVLRIPDGEAYGDPHAAAERIAAEIQKAKA
jgi:very-short-patch-repair endonuclease